MNASSSEDLAAQNTARPTLSIITVNYNMAADLEATIRSVASQDFVSREYIVVDGGSKDGSCDLLEKHAGIIDNWTSERDAGVYDAMNKGTMRARGEWILYLNSGDILLSPTVLSEVFGRVIADDIDILMGDSLVRYADGDERIYPAFPPEDLPYGMVVSHQAMFVRRELAQAMPLTLGKMRSDYEFLVRCWRAGKKFQIVKLSIAEIAAGGWSDRQRMKARWEQWAILKDAKLLSPRILLNFGGAVGFDLMTLAIKTVVPPASLKLLRRLKLKLLGVKGSRG